MLHDPPLLEVRHPTRRAVLLELSQFGRARFPRLLVFFHRVYYAVPL